MRIAILLVCCSVLSVYGQKGFSLVEKKDKKKVEILYNGKLVTAYCYFDSTEKPVLFPVKTLSGITVTRGFPIAPRAGERTDHPHHVGLWFNYESVNGLDFWNNSYAIPAERKPHYGSIKHQKVISSRNGKDKGELVTSSHWVDHRGTVLLEETTRFVFHARKNDLMIDRITTLKGVAPEVIFKDVKDGLLGFRVARELEMPSQQADKFVDANGNVTDVPVASNDGVTGMYTNKEGVRGDDTWAKRSQWTYLEGKKDGESVAVAIIDHPKNIGYPTYWHARGYGLFAANPLGQKIFSNGKEELNFTLKQGQSATFYHRVVIHSGSPLTPAAVDEWMNDFARTK